MAVRSKESLARYAEALKVHLVTDAIAWPGKVYAVTSCCGLQEKVVICIFTAYLEGVMVNV
jgi:hypothetical protein